MSWSRNESGDFLGILGSARLVTGEELKAGDEVLSDKVELEVFKVLELDMGDGDSATLCLPSPILTSFCIRRARPSGPLVLLNVGAQLLIVGMELVGADMAVVMEIGLTGRRVGLPDGRMRGVPS